MSMMSCCSISIQSQSQNCEFSIIVNIYINCINMYMFVCTRTVHIYMYVPLRRDTMYTSIVYNAYTSVATDEAG